MSHYVGTTLESQAATHQYAAETAGTRVQKTVSPAAGNRLVVTLQFNSSTPAGLLQDATDPVQFGAAKCSINVSGLAELQYESPACPGGSIQVSFNWTAANSVSMYITELQNMATGTMFDQTANGGAYQGPGTQFSTGSGGTPAGGPGGAATATLAQTDEIGIASFNFNATGGTITFTSVTNGFTAPADARLLTTAAAPGTKGMLAYKETSVTDGLETTATVSSSSGFALIGTYKGAAAATVTKLNIGNLKPNAFRSSGRR